MNINHIRIFIKVVEAGNFIKASDSHDIPRATLSRNVRQLEDDLGVILIERNTRTHTLTDAGELFYLKVKKLMGDFDELENEIALEHKQVAGKIIFAMPSLLLNLGAQDITAFREKYPELTIVIKTLETGIDASVDKAFYLVLQVDRPGDCNFILVPIAALSFDYFCSGEYLDRFGAPKTPEDLAEHQCIYSPIKAHEPRIWQLGDVKVKPNIVAQVESHVAASQLARQAMGICRVPTIINSSLFNQPKLVPLFDGAYQFKKTLYALYPSKRHMPTKLKILVERLKTVTQEVIVQYEQE